MKKAVFLLTLGLCACAGNSEPDIRGSWIEVLPESVPFVQGMNLKEDGTAESIGMATLKYNKWTYEGDKLILDGESIGNGQTISFSDTMTVVGVKNDTLTVKRGEETVFYVRKAEQGK